MNHIIEIRALSLKQGKREEFHRLYIEQSLPLLKRWHFDVVAHGPSLHDENSYYVIRRFDSLVQREQMEDAYYASDDWRKGPREVILVLIESYTDVVLEVNDITLQGLRKEEHIPESLPWFILQQFLPDIPISVKPRQSSGVVRPESR